MRMLPPPRSVRAGTISGRPVGGPGHLVGHELSFLGVALWGWYTDWDTTTVPDRTYTRQSVATKVGGATATSPGITVTVQN